MPKLGWLGLGADHPSTSAIARTGAYFVRMGSPNDGLWSLPELGKKKDIVRLIAQPGGVHQYSNILANDRQTYPCNHMRYYCVMPSGYMSDAAEQYRKSILIAKVAIGIGGLLFVASLLGLIQPDQIVLVGIVATLDGIDFCGSSRSSLEEITEKTRTHEAPRFLRDKEGGLQPAYLQNTVPETIAQWP
jgi:hypothetical protein